MSKKEMIVQELESVPEKDFDTLLGFIHSLKSRSADDAAPTLLAESSLMKDWLSPEEEAASRISCPSATSVSSAQAVIRASR
jgi:hypothetical protein